MQEPQTRAHRPRHVRDFWRTWLARLEGGFISRGASGAVGILRRLARVRAPRQVLCFGCGGQVEWNSAVDCVVGDGESCVTRNAQKRLR